MRPFYNPRPNSQIQSQNPTNPPHNPNQQQQHAAPHFNAQTTNFPPNFNPPNPGNSIGAFVPNQLPMPALPFVPGGPNFPMMVPNNNMGGFPHLGLNPAAAAQVLAMQQLLGQAQGMNVLASLQLGGNSMWNGGVPRNFGPVGVVPNLGANFPNNLMQGSQLPIMSGPANPQMGGGGSVAGSNNVRPAVMHNQNGPLQPQLFQGKGGGSNNSNFNSQNSTHKGFGGGSHVDGKKDPRRFQNSLSPQANVLKRNGGQYTKFNKKGQKCFPGGKNRSRNFNEPSPEKPRVVVKYSQAEIQQWVEARKKNFPSRANIEKKLSQNRANSEDVDLEAKLRREQLKEVLNKQAELGVEVAELPHGYLSDSELPACRKQNGYNRSNKTHPRKQHNKVSNRTHQQKQHNSGASASRPREPTLLKKLLAADIKRDKHKVLQVLSFMVLNSFFVNRPDKPLEFPTVTVKDCEPEDDIVAEDTKGLETANNNVEKTASVDNKQNAEDCDVFDGLGSSCEDDSEDEKDSSSKDAT